MAYPKGKGRAPGAGRRKGTPNRATLEFKEVLAKHNFCPASAMIEIYTEAKKIYDSYSTIYAAIVEAKSNEQGYPAVVDDKADKYLKIAGDMAREMASYMYPKRKAIETSIDPIILETFEALKNKTNEELIQIVEEKKPALLTFDKEPESFD
jgi:hypothetical protein